MVLSCICHKIEITRKCKWVVFLIIWIWPFYFLKRILTTYAKYNDVLFIRLCSWMNIIIYCYIILFSWNIIHDSYRNITLVCIFRGVKWIGKWGARFLRGLESGGKSFISGLGSGGNVVSGMENVGQASWDDAKRGEGGKLSSFRNWQAKIKTVI